MAASTTCDALQIVAHRGHHVAGVDENTAAAFDAAHQRGFSIEADVWVDAEGVLWVFHDRDTRKLTGTPGLITEKTTAEVEQLRYRKAGSRLLKLTDAMDTFASYPDTRVYLEPKAGYLADDVANLVVARGRTTSTWITDYIGRARAAQPSVKLLKKVAGPLPERPARFVRDGIDIVAGPSGKLARATVARYHRRGLEVQGRDANSTVSWRRAIRAGADGQLTDRPSALKRFCPAALKVPHIAARKSGRTGPRRMAIRGRFFYDVANVRVADRAVHYRVISPHRIVARIKGIRAKRVTVYVRNPNGAVERRVRLGRF